MEAPKWVACPAAMWYRLMRIYNNWLAAARDPVLTLRALEENMRPTTMLRKRERTLRTPRLPSRTLVVPLFLLVTSFSLAGCTRREPAAALSSAMPHQMLAGKVAQAARSAESANTLTREHHVVVEVREGDLEARFRRVAGRCNADPADHCTILLELQAKAATNIDAAIKIASELSTVQSNLESVMGEAAYQTKRTTADIVALEFIVPARSAYWRPIRDSLGDFVGNLSAGLSQAITAVAYIVPWLLVVIPAVYLLRFLWRRRGR
jgi:hypothetical protein